MPGFGPGLPADTEQRQRLDQFGEKRNKRSASQADKPLSRASGDRRAHQLRLL